MGSLRVACSRPVRIQLVAVGLDILRNAQASSSVRLCDSMVTPIKDIPASAKIVIAAAALVAASSVMVSTTPQELATHH